MCDEQHVSVFVLFVSFPSRCLFVRKDAYQNCHQTTASRSFVVSGTETSVAHPALLLVVLLEVVVSSPLAFPFSESDLLERTYYPL
mgnify:CR=1 FL=1